MAIRFVRSSEIIDRLRDYRAIIGMTDTDFKVYGSAEFQKALDAGKFVQTAPATLYVMIGNSSSSVLSLAGSGTDVITHSVDIVLYHQLKDNRGQYSDEASVWYKEFVLRALFGWEPYEGSEALQFGGDVFNSTEGASSYSRTYQFSQQFTIDQSDIEQQDGDCVDFLNLYVYNNAITPPSDDIAKTELDIDIIQD